MNEPAKEPVKQEGPSEKTVKKAAAPFMDKATYDNYEKSMIAKNTKRKGQGLKSIYIRTFEEWSSV